MKTELCQAVVVIRMLITVFLPKQLQRDMLALHLLLKIWKKGFECFKTLVAICRIAALETVLKNGIIQPDKFIKAQAVSADLVHVVVHCLLVHADYIGSLAVGDSALL